MPTHVDGMFYSDLPTDKKESITEDLKEIVPSQTPFLNTTGFYQSAGAPTDTTHYYYDDAYVPLKTTLAAAFSASATSIQFTHDIYKSGQEIECEGEVVVLGNKTAAKTFDVTTRSLGTAAAAAHASGAPVMLVGGSVDEGAAAGTGDVSQEPRKVTTYLREFERIIEASDVVNALQLNTRPGQAYDDKAKKMMRDMKLEIEGSGIWGVAQAPVPSSGTQGKFNGFVERVVGTHTAAMGAADFTMSPLRDAVEDIAAYYDPDMDENAILLCPIRQAFVFDDWGQAHITVQAGDPLAETYGINVRRLRIGPMLIDVIPTTRMNNYSILYQPKFIQWKHLISPYIKRLSDDGRRARGLCGCAVLPEIYNPEAGYVFSGLKTA